MKKILGAALALSLIGSAAFAEITVSGRGYVETHVFNYKTDTNGENGGTNLFSNWDTGDSDVFISGDINGIAGAMLNIDFAKAAESGTLGVGDWNVWIKPLDFLTIKASNEANRVANRYNSIIDKTESKWGTLVMGGDYKTANDDDTFKGYQVNLDFGIVKVDLGFNSLIQENLFAPVSMVFNGTETVDVTFGDKYGAINLPSEAAFIKPMLQSLSDVVVGTEDRAYNSKLGFGARVVVPVEGLLNVDAFFKMGMTDYEEKTYNDETHVTFGAIFDIVAINNMGLALGYIGHYDDEGADGVLTSAVDVRFQYNLADNMGIALHNNATFKMPEGYSQFADKLNLGFMYGLTDVATLYIEVQNYMENYSPDVGDGTMKDVVTVYPRFAFAFAEGVTMKTGLRADFGVTDDYKRMEIALPLSMEVVF